MFHFGVGAHSGCAHHKAAAFPGLTLSLPAGGWLEENDQYWYAGISVLSVGAIREEFSLFVSSWVKHSGKMLFKKSKKIIQVVTF